MRSAVIKPCETDECDLDHMAAGIGSGDVSLSVVVPLLNEQQNVIPLVTAVRAALDGRYAWELLLIDDGSTDRTADVARDLAAHDPCVRLIRLARNYGQASATQAGFDHARGATVVTLDGDLQNDPADIPNLIDKLEQGFDLVVGYRERRQDRLLTRRIPSLVANRILAFLTGVKTRDVGCSLKAYRGPLVQQLRLYSDLHRFVPALAAVHGARIAEIPVRHHPRQFGHSKYGLSRVLKVLADFITIKMIRSFRERPLMMLALGAWIAVVLACGFALGALLPDGQSDAGGRVVFFGATLLWLGLAGHLLLLGLLTEVVAREHHRPTDDPAAPWEMA